MFAKRLKKTAKLVLYHLSALIAAIAVTAFFMGVVYLFISFVTDHLYSVQKFLGMIGLGIFSVIIIYLFIYVLLRVWRFIDWLFLEPYKSWRESKKE
jgi:hypothetical protein